MLWDYSIKGYLQGRKSLTTKGYSLLKQASFIVAPPKRANPTGPTNLSGVYIGGRYPL
jgi:hypothetical protein